MNSFRPSSVTKENLGVHAFFANTDFGLADISMHLLLFLPDTITRRTESAHRGATCGQKGVWRGR